MVARVFLGYSVKLGVAKLSRELWVVARVLLGCF